MIAGSAVRHAGIVMLGGMALPVDGGIETVIVVVNESSAVRHVEARDTGGRALGDVDVQPGARHALRVPSPRDQGRFVLVVDGAPSTVLQTSVVCLGDELARPDPDATYREADVVSLPPLETSLACPGEG